MTPAGYMAKRVLRKAEWLKTTPDWFKATGIDDVYSVSGCMSKDFTDHIPFWEHNGYWLFNSVESIQPLAAKHSFDLTGYQFFFYEVYELEFDQKGKQWQRFESEDSLRTEIQTTDRKQLEGYDVVTFFARTSPECSPLSCNSLADTLPVNRHCLLGSFDEAKQLIEIGAFDQSETGPYRIFAVYSIDQPR
jgi:hypothetical protein